MEYLTLTNSTEIIRDGKLNAIGDSTEYVQKQYRNIVPWICSRHDSVNYSLKTKNHLVFSKKLRIFAFINSNSNR